MWGKLRSFTWAFYTVLCGWVQSLGSSSSCLPITQSLLVGFKWSLNQDIPWLCYCKCASGHAGIGEKGGMCGDLGTESFWPHSPSATACMHHLFLDHPHRSRSLSQITALINDRPAHKVLIDIQRAVSLMVQNNLYFAVIYANILNHRAWHWSRMTDCAEEA